MTGAAPRRASFDAYRLVVAAALLLSLFATLRWLQGRYDKSDHRKAVTLVQTYRALPSGPTIPDRVLARHPGLREPHLAWESELLSSCLGHVRVSCTLRDDARPVETYAFDVDLSTSTIHPTDPKTVEVLRALTASTATVGTGKSIPPGSGVD